MRKRTIKQIPLLSGPNGPVLTAVREGAEFVIYDTNEAIVGRLTLAEIESFIWEGMRLCDLYGGEWCYTECPEWMKPEPTLLECFLRGGKM